MKYQRSMVTRAPNCEDSSGRGPYTDQHSLGLMTWEIQPGGYSLNEYIPIESATSWQFLHTREWCVLFITLQWCIPHESPLSLYTQYDLSRPQYLLGTKCHWHRPSVCVSNEETVLDCNYMYTYLRKDVKEIYGRVDTVGIDQTSGYKGFASLLLPLCKCSGSMASR